MPVGNKSFKSADSYALAVFASDAVFFTLIFLRADTSAYSRKKVFLLDFSVG